MKISPNVKPAAWGAVGGAIALAILGFTWGGWVTNSSATTMAQDHANIEIAKVLAPICFLQFNQQPDAVAKMVELKGFTSSYQQSSQAPINNHRMWRKPGPRRCLEATKRFGVSARPALSCSFKQPSKRPPLMGPFSAWRLSFAGNSCNSGPSILGLSQAGRREIGRAH